MHEHEQFDSPVDLPGRRLNQPHPLRWTTITLAIASLFLLATNAETLRQWVDEQPAGPTQARLSALAGQWQALTDKAGLGATRALLHHEWKEAQASRFEEKPAAPSEQQ